MKKTFSIILLLMPAFAFAADWSCRKNDLEITCTSGKCTKSDAFTPISVDFNDHGSINICAYSGCWEGKGKVLKSENHLLLSGHKLAWSGTTNDSGDFMIALDSSSGIAVIDGVGFAMPLICNSGKNTARPPSESK